MSSTAQAAFPVRGILKKTEIVTLDGRRVYRCTYRFLDRSVSAYSENECPKVITLR